MMLFLLCQGLNYLGSAFKGAIFDKLTDLLATSHTLENLILIYASSLSLNKNNNRSVREIFAKKVIQSEPREMTLSQGIYALWSYEIFIAPYINSYEQTLKPQIMKWNRELKKEIMPQLFKELSSKLVETGIDENLPNEPSSFSTFELALIYETILKNEDKFLIISQQDFTNNLIEKSQGIFLDKIKWQSYFWILLSMAFFTLPWYLFRSINPRILITAMIGILLAVITFYLRYKNTKYYLLNRKEWINKNWRNFFSGILFGVLFLYFYVIFRLAVRINIKPIITITLTIVGWIVISIIAILANFIFHIKLPDELKAGKHI